MLANSKVILTVLVCLPVCLSNVLWKYQRTRLRSNDLVYISVPFQPSVTILLCNGLVLDLCHSHNTSKRVGFYWQGSPLREKKRRTFRIKKKFLIFRRLGVVKRVKIVKNRFHNSIREKQFKIISVSLWSAITFKPFEIETCNWSRMKDNSKIFRITK